MDLFCHTMMLHSLLSRLGLLLLVFYDNCSGVDHLCVMLSNQLDETFLMELDEGGAGQGTPHFQPLRHDGRGDQLVGGHFLVQLVICELVTDLSLGPLLLLGLATSSSLFLLLCLLGLFSPTLSSFCILLRRHPE